MLNFGLINQIPFYPHADGIFAKKLHEVKRGEIVVQSLDQRLSSCSSSCSSDPFFIERENCTMKGLTVLNGQGDSELENIDFANTMQVLGIVEMDNNCRDRFNIISDGILDVRNNGNEVITVGDTVMAYYPTLGEIRQGGGKNQNKEEAAGVVKAWFKPYKAGLHAMTVKGIYTCLKDTRNSKAYLPAYRRACRQFVDSVAGMAMVMLAKTLPDLMDVMTGPDATRIDSPAEILSFFLAKVGHSKFKDEEGAANNAIKNEVLDALFVPFSTDSRNAATYLYPQNLDGLSRKERNTRRKLNDIQQESTSLFLEANLNFQQQRDNQIIGQAKSTALPGMDLSLHVRQK